MITRTASRPVPQTATFFQTITMLFKLRIVVLLLFAGVGGAFLAARGFPGFGALILLTLTGGSAAAGASALNQYFERDIDAEMNRTRKRPLVMGAIANPSWVLPIALALIFVPSLAVLPFNPALAFWSIAGAVIYVGIYTLWLKPRSVLNIVIGGFAGTCAVMSGGAAVSSSAAVWTQPGAIILGLLIFLWTPTHFWSLALMYRQDYARVSMPMLPVRISPRESAFWIALHTVATGFAALALSATVTIGWLYLIPIALATGDLLLRCVRLYVTPTGQHAKSVFLASNIYLTVVLLMLCITAGKIF
ncbi:MAG: protoheme IX farnesyltransferase [Chloroflexi bacterium]|nr:protoheme IX farnesyltransferase [Chloroflexota bacterium]